MYNRLRRDTHRDSLQSRVWWSRMPGGVRRPWTGFQTEPAHARARHAEATHSARKRRCRKPAKLRTRSSDSHRQGTQELANQEIRTPRRSSGTAEAGGYHQRAGSRRAHPEVTRLPAEASIPKGWPEQKGQTLAQPTDLVAAAQDSMTDPSAAEIQGPRPTETPRPRASPSPARRPAGPWRRPGVRASGIDER